VSWAAPRSRGDGLSSFLRPARIEEDLHDSFVQASNALLGYRPDLAHLLPPEAVTLLRAWHSPLAADAAEQRPVRHQLLGPAFAVQDAPERKGRSHLLLAQFDSDHGLFWGWGDAGVLQFWITPRDLAAGRFDQAVATLDGH
jgi:uncharacterized protein YwqG